jgi:hypothetical protein
MGIRLNLTVLPYQLGICRLEPSQILPAWALQSPFSSISRTADELSIICEAQLIPGDIKSETGWRVIKLEGPFDFALIGIMLSVTTPLAEAGVSILAFSTFDTDYVLVKEANIAIAINALIGAGHVVHDPTR